MKEFEIYKLIIIIFFIVFFQSLPAVSQTADNDVIMANIEIMNRRINNLNRTLNSCNIKLKSLHNKIKELEDIIERSNIELNESLLRLKTDYNAIKSEYSRAINSIDSILKIDRKKNIKAFDMVNLQLNDISRSIDLINLTIIHLSEKINKIPEIYFEPYSIPVFNLGIAVNKFFTFSQSRINVSPAFDFNASLKVYENFNCWLNYTSPFVLTISYNASDNIHKISDRWNAMIYSSGVAYSLLPDKQKSISIDIESGVFYGKVDYDEFFNTTLNLDRNLTKGTETFGGLINFGFSYNQFFNKNPISLFIKLNNHIAFKNIVLQSDNTNKFDFGAFLFSASAGVKFCMW